MTLGQPEGTMSRGIVYLLIAIGKNCATQVGFHEPFMRESNTLV